MRRCRHCRAELPESESAAHFCPACRAALASASVAASAALHEAPAAGAAPPDARDSQSALHASDLPPAEGEHSQTGAGGASFSIAQTVDFGAQDPAETLQIKSPEESGGATRSLAERGMRSLADAGADGFSLAAGGAEGETLLFLQTLEQAAQRPGMTATTSLRAQWGQDGDSESTLVIRQRHLRDAHDPARSSADFELLKLLGKGGMGTVFAARQGSMDRTVALKMLNRRESQNADAQGKFLWEACVTGDLEHPNIVPIYDLGANADGAYFYAMKCVHGTPWDEALGAKSLDENLEILMRVADAVGFAHSRGIVHRDLKPANIMLGGFGEVLVMDWGLAMPTDLERRFGGMRQSPSIGGTPAYMAPEMVAGPLENIGPGADIYLLGGILYEIVTGLRPHGGKSIEECIYAAARNYIQPTDKSGELVDIAMRAMEYEPADRYASVAEFQQAIRAYRSHSESIALSELAANHLAQARRSREYDDYNRALYGFQQAVELWDGNARGRTGVEETKLAYAAAARDKGDYELGLGLLDAALPAHAALHREITLAQREREARQYRLRTYKRLGLAMAATFLLVVSGAAMWIKKERDEAIYHKGVAEKNWGVALKNELDAKRQRDIADGQKKRAQDNERKAIEAQKRSDESARIAEDARKAEAREAYVARIGAAAAKIVDHAYGSARELLLQCVPAGPDDEDHRNWEWGRLWYLCHQGARVTQAEAPLDALAIAARDGAMSYYAAAGSGGAATVWSADGAVAARLETGAQHVHALAFSPDGAQIAAGTDRRTGLVQLFDAATGAPLRVLDDPAGHTEAVLSVEFSADGRLLLTGSRDGTAKVWRLETGRVLATLHGHWWWVWQARFAPPSQGPAGSPGLQTKIVTVSQDGTAIVWTDDTGRWNSANAIRQSPPFAGHTGPVYAAAFAHDSRTVATAGHDQVVRVWSVDDLQPIDFHEALRLPAPQPEAVPHRPLTGHTAPIRSLVFSRGDGLLISGGHDNTLALWDWRKGRSTMVLRGHGQWVRACALAPQEKTVLSASHDGTVRLWDIDGYAEVRVLRGQWLAGHEDAVLAASISPDAEQIVTASRDRTLKTWDVVTGKELRPFHEGHSFLASSASFSRDGRRLATAAVDQTVRLWDAETGVQLGVLRGTGRSAVVALSPDGARVVTGGPARKAPDQETSAWVGQLWDAETGQALRELPGHSGPITAVAYAPSGKFFYTGDATGRGILWDGATGQRVRELRWHRARIVAARFLADDTLLTAAAERVVARWRLSEGTVDESRLLLHDSPLAAMDVDPAGRRVVTSCIDNSVRIWDLATRTVSRTLFPPAPGRPAEICAVALSPDGERVLAANAAQRTVRLFDAETGREIEYPQSPMQQGPFLVLAPQHQLWSATFAPQGHVLTLGGDQVKLWDAARSQLPFRRMRVSFSPHGVVASACFSSDGARIVSGSWDGTANIWDTQTAQSIRKLTGQHSGPVNSAAFSPDAASAWVATASDDTSVVLWESGSGRFVRRFVGHQDRVLWVAFSPDGRRLLTASVDGTARIWNIADGAALHVLEGHTDAVRHAIFSADGVLVASAGDDNTAIVWDAATAQPRRKLIGHTAAVTSVAFTPDGRRVFTASEDFHTKVWDASTGQELLTLAGHEREVAAVAYAARKPYLVTAGHDGAAIVWFAAPWTAPREQLLSNRLR